MLLRVSSASKSSIAGRSSTYDRRSLSTLLASTSDDGRARPVAARGILPRPCLRDDAELAERRLEPTQAAARSCGEHLVDLVEQRPEVVAEHLRRLAEPARLDERRVAEVVGRDRERGGDVVADALEPGELLGGERRGPRSPAGGARRGSARGRGRGTATSSSSWWRATRTSETRSVSTRCAGAAHLRAVELLVGLPELARASTGAAGGRSPAASSFTSRNVSRCGCTARRRGSGAR